MASTKMSKCTLPKSAKEECPSYFLWTSYQTKQNKTKQSNKKDEAKKEAEKVGPTSQPASQLINQSAI